jgi:hypothetical protein
MNRSTTVNRKVLFPFSTDYGAWDGIICVGFTSPEIMFTT